MKKITQKLKCNVRWLNVKRTVLLISTVLLSIFNSYAQTAYCSATNAGGNGSLLANVTLGSINNTTGSTASTNFYSHWPGQTTSVVIGSTVSLSVTIDPPSTYSGAIVSVWFDWNRDGVLDPSEWTQVGTNITSNTSTTVNITVPATASPGLTRMRVRSRGAGNPNGSGDACGNLGSGETEDYDITLVPATPCTGTPTAGTASITPASRTCSSQPFTLSVTGTTIAGNMTYQWQRSPQGANTFTNISGATNLSYTVTNQTVTTDYRFVVTCTTSGGTNTSNIVTAIQPTAITTNFFEGFETTPGTTYADGTVPTCWSYFKVGTTSTNYTSQSSPKTGTNSFYYYPSSTGEVFLVSPETDNLGNGSKQVRFWANLSSFYPGTQVRVYRLNGSTSAATRTLIQTININKTGYNEYVVPLGVTTDDYFAIAVYGASGQYPSVYIDDIYYEDLWPCFFPMNIKVAGITQTAADISWAANSDPGVTGYEYEVRTSGAAGSGPVGLEKTGTTTGTTVSLTGLNASSDYTVYVRSVCGATPGPWTVYPVSFSTLCGVVMGDFFQGFETTSIGSSSSNTVPTCWTYFRTVGTSGYGYTGSSTSYAHTGANGFYTYLYNTELLLISPETDNLGHGRKQVRFWANLSYFNPGTYIDVYTMDGKTATSTKTLVQSIPLTQTGWQEFTVPLPVTTDDYFAFRFYGAPNQSPNIYLDDIYYEETPPPVVTTTKVDVACYGTATGQAFAKTDGGRMPLSYSWSPSGGNSYNALGLTAGSYTVTVTDALNRTATSTVTIVELGALTSNITYKNISCHGKNDGSISVNPSGGVAPYTYLWTGGARTSSINNLSAGVYTVTITDSNGCTGTESITIVDPASLSASIGAQTNVSIYGGSDGSATVNVAGGTIPYTYLWLPSGETTATSSNLKAGAHSVTVTDAGGCAVTQDFVITEPPAPFTVNLVSLTDVTCYGTNNGLIKVDAIGGYPPYTYSWSPSGGTLATATNLTSGSHSVVVTDATGEKVMQTYTINEPSAIVLTIDSISDVTCVNMNNGSATVHASGGTAPYTYIWSNGQTGSTVDNLVAGYHFVQVIDANDCISRESFIIEAPTALSVSSSSLINVSCNGTKDGAIKVIASGGTAPYTYSWNTGQTGDMINNLTGGIYTVTVTDTNNCIQTKSFTVVEPAVVHPPVALNQNFCTSAKLSDVIISGSNIKWYDAPTGGNLLPATTVLVNGIVYYASQSINNCESSSRASVQVNLYQPVSLTTQKIDVCNGTIIQDVILDGNGYTQLKWYNSTTSTTALPHNYLLISGTYYVSTFTNNVCESVKYPIQINVLASVPAPIIGAQSVCGVKTFNDLVVTKVPGAVINWYASAQSVTPIAVSSQVLSGTYYVEQVVGSCKSTRVAVPIQVISITSPNLTNVTVCNGTTIGDLNNDVAPIKYVWYLDSSTMVSLPDTYVIKAGVYYIAQDTSGCVSNKTKVDVVVNSRPSNPTGQAIQTFGFAATVSNLRMNEAGVEWYSSYNDAISLSNQLLGGTLLQDGNVYYAVIRGANNCPSYPTEVKVVLNVGIGELDLTYLKYYPNPTDSFFTIEYNEVIKKIEIYSITGQKVLTREFNEKQIKLDLSGYGSGAYMVRIETEKASQFIKIVKK